MRDDGSHLPHQVVRLGIRVGIDERLFRPSSARLVRLLCGGRAPAHVLVALGGSVGRRDRVVVALTLQRCHDWTIQMLLRDTH